MKVERALYQAIKASSLSSHAAWHAARIPAGLVPVAERAAWRAARAATGNPKDWSSAGAGREFLVFHRMMMRHHAWFMANTPSLTAAFSPWTDLPPWLKDRLPCRYLKACLDGIEAAINDKDPRSDERLGAFLEATDRTNSLGSNIHNIAHGLIALIEVREFRRRPAAIADAGMDDPATAHHNELFWNLHGWIDSLYARWQRRHGEPVDLSPLDPAMGHGPGTTGGGGGGSGGAGGGGGGPHHSAPLTGPVHTAAMAHPGHEEHTGDKDDHTGGKDVPSHEAKPFSAPPGIQAIVRARFNAF